MKNRLGVLLPLIFIAIISAGFAQGNSGSAEATEVETNMSFRDLPLLESPYIAIKPIQRNDDIAVGELQVSERNKSTILKISQEIFKGTHGNYDALLISHKNKLVYESYYKKGRINLPHEQSSATKGYTSLILARAIQLGYLTMADLHKPIINFLKDLDRSKLVDGAEKITLHKILTMRSGIRISEDKRREFEKNPNQLKGQGLVQIWLEQSEPITEASQSYLYGPDPVLVMQVIDAVVPGSAKDFIKTELLDKLGITNYIWQTGVSGLPEAGWRVGMTSRDMLKWGILVLNKGKWKGEQLVPEAFVAKATSKITKPTANWQPEAYSYGYFWYQTDIMVDDKNYNANFTWGGGGQYVIVVKELDLVITITGHDGKDTIMDQVTKNIVPAFVQS